MIKRGEQKTELQGTEAMSDLCYPEETIQTRCKKKEKVTLYCKLHSQTGSLHVFHTDQVQTQKLRDVQHNIDYIK